MAENLYLFADNNEGVAENLGSYRLYDMKIEGDPEGVSSGVNYVDYIRYDRGGVVFKTNVLYKSGTTIEYKLNEDITTFGDLNLIFQIFTNTYKNNSILIQQGNVALDNGNRITIIPNNGIYRYTFTESQTNAYICFGCNSVNWTGIKAIEFFRAYQDDNLVLDLRPCFDTEGIACVYDEVSKTYLYNQGTGNFVCKKTLRDYQPVLDSNNIPCLLDKKNKKYYYNKGTGDFLYGGIQTPKDGYTEIEYIESNGTQYIDTEVIPTTNTDIDMTCRACDYNESPTINNSYILNGLAINSNTYQYNDTDTTVQPNLVASEGATLTMGTSNLNKLDEEDIEVATNNGWSLV